LTPQTQHIIGQIKARIDQTRRTLYRQELFTAALKAFSVVGLLGTLFVFMESLAEFDSATRTFLVFSHMVISAILAVWLMWRPLFRFLGILKPHSDREVARMIGAKYEKIADRLENMLDLSDMVKNGDFSGSPELIEVALEHFGKSTTGINFAGSVSFTQLQSLAKTVGAIGTTVTALAVIPGTPFHDAVNRMVHYEQEFKAPAAFVISVVPGNIDVVKGETVTVEATLSAGISTDPLPNELTLSYSEEGVRTTEAVVLRADSSGVFRFLFPPLKQTVSYTVFGQDVSSDRFTITVTDRPFVRSLSVSLTPPGYTKLKFQSLEENIGDILVLPGTRVRWNVLPSKSVASATIVFANGTALAMTPRGDEFTGEYSPLKASSYHIELKDENGNTNQNIIEYSIGMLADEYPTVAIISPGKNIDVTDAMLLPMAFDVADDFGISQLNLKFRLKQSKYSAEETEMGTIIPFDTLTVTKGVLDYLWDLSLLGLVPEDIVEYFVEVQDNDAVTGPKTARSQTYLIRLPSLEEVFSDADKTHDLAGKTLEESLKEAKELQKDLKELSDDMKRNQQMDWQKQKKAEEVMKRYDEIQKKVDDVNKTIDEMTQNLQRNNTLSKETLEKYMELQKALSEVSAPEFQKAMQRMKDAMQNVSPEQMREAMQQAQFNEEQFRQSIERTMSLLKRIQIEQKMDEMVKRAEQMKKAQEEINTQTQELQQNDSQKATELAQKQDQIDKQLAALQKELNDLQKKMEEFPKEMPLDKMDNVQQAARDRSMQNAIKQSAQQLRSLQTERAMTSQQQASSGMNEMQQQLSELQEQLLNNQMQQTMNSLRKAMQDLLHISQQQEQLKNTSRTLDPNSQQFREIAQKQQNLQNDLNNVANALAELSQQSFVVTPEMGKQIGRAMGQMQQAMSGIEQRNGPSASAQQSEAMASLNKAATQMQGAMQQMQQQGGQGGGSLMQQLRGMAMQQQQINMQTQQMGEQEGTSQQKMQEMGRLARQQEAVRKSLEQLQREAEGTPEKNRVMGDLDKIADEMKEVVQQLQQNQADPNMVQKQERILSRLLQAQRSMRERDYEQKRKGTSATTPAGKSPAELSAKKTESQLQKDLQRAQESGYSKEYLELIRKYYESLERKEQ
jgi:predicted RNase H-like HicB family nuclease